MLFPALTSTSFFNPLDRMNTVFGTDIFDACDILLNGVDSSLMRTDIRECAKTCELDIDLPGFEKKDISLEIRDGYMTVSATTDRKTTSEKKEETAAQTETAAEVKAEGTATQAQEKPAETAAEERVPETGTYLRRERFHCSCTRRFYVGKDVEPKDVTARFENGTLHLSFPKEPARKLEENRRIAIA